MRLFLYSFLGCVFACSDAEPAKIVPRCGRGFAESCDPDQEAAYARLSSQSINVHRLWRRGGPEWSETLVDFSDRGYNELQRKACGVEFGKMLTENCAYQIVLVVESDGTQGTGCVRYASADDLESARESACMDYSNCIAAGYVGKTIRLPSNMTGLMSLAFFVQAILPSAIERDLQLPALRLDMEITQDQLDRFYQRDWQSDPQLRFLVPHYESEVRYYKRKIAEIE